MLTLDDLSPDVELEKLSTLQMPCKAQWFKAVSSIEETQQLFALIRKEKLPYWVLGKGSNTLFDDRGIKGVVIHNKLTDITYQGNAVKVGAGYSFSYLGMSSARKGLSGLEFAAGIPGSVGGAIYMNAGIGPMDVSCVVREVGFVHESGTFEVFSVEQCQFSYRSSIFQRLRGLVVYAIFELEPKKSASQEQKALLKKRYDSQPYKEKSLGCFFRNPEGESAGKLIDDLGLKGLCVGGAKVSELHANFLINQGSACRDDFLKLIDKIKQEVKEKRGIELQTEIKIAKPYEVEDDV